MDARRIMNNVDEDILYPYYIIIIAILFVVLSDQLLGFQNSRS